MAIDVRGFAPLLLVFDLPRSVAFYRDVLGFEIVQTSVPDHRDGWALLKLGSTEIMLNSAYEENARPAVPAPGRVEAHADTAIFFGCPDVEAAWAQLRASGIDAQEPVMTSYGFRSLSISDPDGFTLVFHWPGTQATYDEWVARYGLEPMTITPSATP